MRSDRDYLDPALARTLKHPLLEREEELRLLEAWQKRGDRAARERLVTCNQKLVYSIARRYQRKGITLEDLMQEGNRGLALAIDRWRDDRGAKLSTFASWWIRSKVQRATREQSRLIRVPVCRQDGVARSFLVEHVILSGDEKVNGHGSQGTLTRWDLEVPGVADPGEEERDQAEAAELRRRQVARCLRKLEERERYVIKRRFGLLGAEALLQEIGDELGVSRERVRQIEFKALEKLKRQASWDAFVADMGWKKKPA